MDNRFKLGHPQCNIALLCHLYTGKRKLF